MQSDLLREVIELLSACRDMSIATVRPDGAPQATVVSFVNDGLLIYFGCGAGSQKAANIAHEPRVSLTITPTYQDWNAIKGLSMAATAREVTDLNEMDVVWKLMSACFPQMADIEIPDDVEMKVFCLQPTVISLLDYAKGFGHTELAHVEASDVSISRESMRHHWPMPARAAATPGAPAASA